MPSFFSVMSALHSGSAGPAGSIAAAGESLARDPLSAPLTPDPVGLDLLARFTSLAPDQIPTRLELVFVGASAPTDPLVATAQLGDTAWLVTLTTGVVVILDNGGLPCIDARSLVVVGPDPVWTPVAAARFSGAMLAAIGSSITGVAGRATVASRWSGSWSLALFGGFADGPSDAQRRAMATPNYQAIVYRGGGQHATQANAGSPGAPPFPAETLNQDAVLADCVWSGVAPWGAVYVDAADVGVSTTERVRIPPDVASNSPGAYRRYPAAFLRRPTFGRGVQVLEQRADAITTPAGALTVFATSIDLAYSAWNFQIDGAAFRVVLSHGAVAGLRRPADIWQRVIVPAMNSGTPLELIDPAAGLFGGMISRLEFLEYAGFIDARGEDGVQAYFPVVQTGGVTPPTPPPPP